MKIKVLSPLHIGCGESYNALISFVEGNRLFVLDIERLFKTIGTELSLKFGDWITKNMDKIDELKQEMRQLPKKKQKDLNSKIWELKRIFTLKDFLIQNHISLSKVKQACIYSVNCKNKPHFNKEIHSFIKQMHKPYIPGTEIKGAIRTVLLYKVFCEDRGIQEFLENSLKRMLDEEVKIKNIGRFTYKDLIEKVKNRKPNNRKEFKEFNLFKKALSERTKKIESKLQEFVFRGKNNDAKYDLLKFLHIGDSVLLNPSDVLCVSYAEPFNISRKFQIFYEYMLPDTEILLTEFRLELIPEKLEKTGLKEKQERLINNLEAVFLSCFAFTKDLLNEEISFFEKHSLSDVVDQLIQIEQKNDPKNPVIRIGKDEGYLSLTIALAVKKLMPDLYENILIHATKNISYDSSHGGLLPKSRKLVRWDGRRFTSGWIQLVFDNVQSETKSSKEVSQGIDIKSIEALKRKFRVRELKR